MERLRADEAALPSASGARQRGTLLRLELLHGYARGKNDQYHAESGVIYAGQPFQRPLQHEGRYDGAGDCRRREQVRAALVHDSHVPVSERARYAVGGDQRENGAGDDSRVFVREEDTEDGHEDEAAARAHEDAEHARSEAYYGEYQPLDRLLPAERGQPLY